MTLLCSLSDSWDHLVMDLGSTLVTFRMDDVVSFFLSEEIRRKSSDLAKKSLVVCRRSNNKGSKMTTSLERVDPNLMENQRLLESTRQNFGTMIRLGTSVKTVKI